MESPYKKQLLAQKQGKGKGGSASASRRRRNVEFTIILVLCTVAVAMGYAFIHRMFISPPVETTVTRVDSPMKKTGRIQVNVLNATSQHELARTAMTYLRDRGFDVVELGNYSEAQYSSVISRTPDMQSARNVAHALGIADSCVTAKPDSTLYLDASVVLGGDWRHLKPWK